MAVCRQAKLLSGHMMPCLGFGTYLLSGDDLKQSLEYALHCGYRHIDTAKSYQNEAEIGDLLTQTFRQNKVKRKDIFLTTKVPPIYLSGADVQTCVMESLDNLNSSYIDMLLIHAPWGIKNSEHTRNKPSRHYVESDFEHYDLQLTWKAMENLVNSGKVKSLGVSNFCSQQLNKIFEKAVQPLSNLQCECHVYLQQCQLRHYCNSKNIAITAYSPLGAPGRPSYRYDSSHPVLLEDPTIVSIAELYGRSAAQIVLRYLLQLGVCPIPKSTSPARKQQNYQVYDFSIKPAHMDLIAKLNADFKYFTFTYAHNHPEYYHNEQF